MPRMTTPYLAETILLEGPDAIAFAQAQFSSNVNGLTLGRWQFSAWLDPQGRVTAFFHLARLADDRLILLLRGGRAADVVDALRRFVFRSKLTLTAMAPRSLSTESARPLYDVVQSDDGNFLLGCDTHSLRIAADSIGDDAWRLAQLRNGWPWLPQSLLNELLPPALSLHRLHAVVIDKGCYPGQEIVARLHYRGGNKKHLHRIEISLVETLVSQASTPTAAGDIARVGTNEKIFLLDVIHHESCIEALAVMNDDVAANAINGTIQYSDDRTFALLLEMWCA